MLLWKSKFSVSVFLNIMIVFDIEIQQVIVKIEKNMVTNQAQTSVDLILSGIDQKGNPPISVE